MMLMIDEKLPVNLQRLKVKLNVISESKIMIFA